ncbi:hypothetical protein ACFLRC_03575, partial [Candidatus Altiarchaeota archaeon]
MDTSKDKRLLVRALFLLTVIIVVFSLFVSAQDSEEGPGSYSNGTSDGGGMMDAMQNTQTNMAIESMTWILDVIYDSISWNPRVFPLYSPGCDPCASEGTSNLIKSMLIILIPLYQILILYYGILIIYGSKSPRERVMYKDRLQKLLAGMILVALSPIIFQIFLDLESVIVWNILDIADDYLAQAGWGEFLASFIIGMVLLIAIIALLVYFGIGLPWIPIVLFLLTPILLIVGRYVFVGIMAILFPLTLFFYTFEFTRGLGQKLLMTSLKWIFMP